MPEKLTWAWLTDWQGDKMRFVIQRVKSSKLSVNNELISEIGVGLMVLVGVCKDDKEELIVKAANKLVNLRIFEDENEKLNKSVIDVGGEIMLISNFTLCTIESSGNRPSFILSADKEKALDFYNKLGKEIEKLGVKVKFGVFGADMQIDAHLDGPITIYKELV